MKALLCIIFPFSFFSAIAQIEKESISIGSVQTIHSKILNEDRKIFVYSPQNFGDIYEKPRYPVVYVMDGEAHFNSVVGIVEQLSEVNGNKILPQMMVVGIANTNRMRDLTPSHISKSISLDTTTLASTGGGENFTSFLEKELIPYIDSNYTTAPYRTIVGHSLGGLMVMDELLNHSKLFNAYIAIDPSMWWDNQKLLNQAKKDFSEKNFENKTLFVAMANTMKPGMDTLSVKSDTTENTEHIRSILELINVLKINSQNKLKYNWKYYNDDSHGSVPLIAAYDGLRFIFRFITFSLPNENNLNADSILFALREHYKNVSLQMGYNVTLPEATLNGYGYSFLQKKDWAGSYKFFKLNTDLYPKSANVYDSMGDYFDTSGDAKKAIENYTKALSIFGNQVTQEKLNNIKNKK